MKTLLTLYRTAAFALCLCPVTLVRAQVLGEPSEETPPPELVTNAPPSGPTLAESLDAANLSFVGVGWSGQSSNAVDTVDAAASNPEMVSWLETVEPVRHIHVTATNRPAFPSLSSPNVSQ